MNSSELKSESSSSPGSVFERLARIAAATSPAPNSAPASGKLVENIVTPNLTTAPSASLSSAPSSLSGKKRSIDSLTPPVVQHQPVVSSTSSSKKKVAKKDLPHALIWVCHHGPGQNGKWTQKSLKIVGVYRSKDEAEQKKLAITDAHLCAGYGDIVVGDTWMDEIDLVVRPVEECTL